MTTVVIPDIHLKTARADAILAAEPGYDKVIYLNDIFDNFNDTPEANRNAAVWFKERLSDPRNIFLHSNHVWSYMFSGNPFARQCSGFTHEKALRIWEVMNADGQGFNDFMRQKPYHVESGVLFTHAGVSRRLLEQWSVKDELGEVTQWLDAQHARAIEAYSNDGHTFLYEAGYMRSGRYPVGGVVWCDREEFKTTSFPQCVGHHPHDTPIFAARIGDSKRDEWVYARKAKPDHLAGRPWALYLDTHLNHYAVLKDGTMTVKECVWDSQDSLDKTTQVWQGRVI